MHYLTGLLIGDYILQNDWMANNKTWANRRWVGLPIALFHAALVTLAIFLCTAWATKTWDFWSWWKLLIIWSSHGIQDWTRAPRWWMEKVAKQFVFFKENMPEAYLWAIFVVDNIWHIALLFFLAHL